MAMSATRFQLKSGLVVGLLWGCSNTRQSFFVCAGGPRRVQRVAVIVCPQ
jgi:hypothetical protein